jgi:alkylation response protein AidB-like acyl-CoA dehydrogenase
VQFDKPIGSFQAVKHKIANLYIEAYSCTAATRYAAMAIADDQRDAAAAVEVAKLYVGDAYARIAGEALQVHGGIGFTWECDVHLYLRRAKSNQVLFGDSDWHREQLCRILGA